MRDPFIAIDAATNVRSHARMLRRTWESALGGSGPKGAVRPVIEESWKRTEDAGIDPDHPDPLRAFERDELTDHRAASGLKDCVEVLRSSLGGFALDAEHIFVLVDAECRILWLEGDPRVRQRADRIAFEEGMYWTEESVGTNAIGTALAIDHAVQIFSAEHYSAKQHPWWCSAAPIHDPVSGDVVGVVDLSGPMHTAHPHSLALVTAAAGLAEGLLRAERALSDERLRSEYLEQTLGMNRRAGALVAPDGRVLHTERESLVSALVEVPRGGGSITLPGGEVAVAEPLRSGRGYIVWDTTRAGAPAGVTAPAAMRLDLLGGHAPRVQVGDGEPVTLSVRHAELLCILALHPEGVSSEQLTRHMYGDLGKEVSARAEVSRLRKLLPGLIEARPYRLTAAVSGELFDVERSLRRGDLAGALAGYHSPLLPDSTAPRVAEARAELETALRRAALAGPVGHLWAWLETRSGKDDRDALAQFVRRAEPSDARRSIAAARLRSLQLRD